MLRARGAFEIVRPETASRGGGAQTLERTRVSRRGAERSVDRKVEGRRLVFTVHVDNDRGLVAAGKVTRVIVLRADFLDRVATD